VRATIDKDSLSTSTPGAPPRVLYFNTGFSRKLNNQAYLKDSLNQLQNFYKYDICILPFFIDEINDQRTLIVSVRPEGNQVDLYDREREIDSKIALSSSKYRSRHLRHCSSHDGFSI
jgi:hypothetical protein